MKKYFHIACIILGSILLFITCNTAYGYLFKERVISHKLIFSLPENGTFLDYHYFLGEFECVILYNDENIYDTFFKNLYNFGPYDVNKIELDLAKAVGEDFFTGKTIVDCTEFFLGIPDVVVGGIIWQLEGETIIYITSKPQSAKMAEYLLWVKEHE